MNFSKKKSPLIFEGAMAERYKLTKNRWIRLTIISTLLPLLFASFVSFYNGSFDLLSMFGNGEIVMSLFSLTIPLLFDLFEIKKEDDEYLSWAFFYCAILVCIQDATTIITEEITLFSCLLHELSIRIKQ